MKDIIVSDWDIREFQKESVCSNDLIYNEIDNEIDNDVENEWENGSKKTTSFKNDEVDSIKEYGQTIVKDKGLTICLISIIGEIEGHECLPSNSKTTKYEHILPKLAEIEDSSSIDGVLLLLNTVGGDVESGLAIAEMVASLSKPTVSLVLGGSHSIGVPLAVSTDYSMIVPSGTMVIHPVRMSGTIIGAPSTFEYFRRMQDRIITFITTHCEAQYTTIEELMMNTQMLTKDVGTILVGKEAVEIGLINEIGGISQAFQKLRELITDNNQRL